MSFETGSIMSTLGLDTSPFAGGMMQATSIASIFPSTVTAFLANPLLGVIDLTKQVGQAISSMVTSAIATLGQMDDLGDMAANLNVSAGFLDSFQAVGKMSGANDAAEVLKFLAKNAYDAQDASGSAAIAFRKLGVQVKDSEGQIRPVADLLFDVADGLSRTPGMDRMAVAMDLLGRSADKMLGTLSQGSAALKQKMADVNPFGGMTDQMANDAGRFSDAFGMLGRAWEGIKRELAIPIGNALLPMLENMLNWIKGHGDEVRTIVKEVVSFVLMALSAVSAAIAGALYLLSPMLSGFMGTMKAIAAFNAAPAGKGMSAAASAFGDGYKDGTKLSTEGAKLAWNASQSLLDAAGKVGEKMSVDVTSAMYDGWRKQEQQRSAAMERAALEGRY